MSGGAEVLWRRLWLGGGSRLLAIALAGADRVPPLRRHLGARARAALAEADTVLFVCHGNINRSAFAAALARERLRGVEVLEAGHDATAGAPSDGFGLAAAAAAGVELGPHRAARLDPAMLGRADLVLVFDARNLLAVAARAPRAARKLRLLGALNDAGPLEIADPHGGPESAYEEAFARINAAFGDAGVEA